MAFNFPYQQQYGYMKKLVLALKAKGVPKETITALSVNAYHESYLNPWTVEGAINPGPPLGANGVNSGRDGLGLWQWTQQGNPLWSHLGDFDWQVNYMISYKDQWDIYGNWFKQAGLADPTPNITNYDEFMFNKKGYNDTQLTQAFIGYWERPAYGAGATRYNNAPSEAPQFRELVNQYYGGNDDNPNHGSPGGGGNGGGVPGKNGSSNSNTSGTLDEAAKELVNKFLSAFKTAITKDMAININDENYSNGNVKTFTKFNNMIQIKTTSALDDLINNMMTQPIAPTPQKPKPDPNTGGTSKPSTGASNQSIYNSILSWCKVNLGKSYNYPEAHPSVPNSPQCVDMIKAIAKYCLNNDALYNALLNGGAGAQDIYGGANLNGTGWKRIAGDIYNDANATKIWNTLPNGAIVFYFYNPSGHVAIKSGDADWVYQQNYNGQGFISTENDMAFRTYTGAGFLGAWVLN